MGAEYTAVNCESNTDSPILAYDVSAIADKESAQEITTAAVNPPRSSRAGWINTADRLLIWAINILLFEYTRGASCAAMPFIVIGNIIAAIFVIICAAILIPIGIVLFTGFAIIAMCCMACSDLAKCLREQRDDLIMRSESSV